MRGTPRIRAFAIGPCVAQSAGTVRSAAQARDQYVSAHKAAEVVRRVADHRREEVARELNRAEDKALDEAAALLFVRKAG